METWESLVKESPAEFDYRFGLADAYSTQGMQTLWRSHVKEAAEFDYPSGLTEAHNTHGMQTRLKEAAEAEPALREAESRLSILLKERPGDVRIRQSLSSTLGNLGVILRYTRAIC